MYVGGCCQMRAASVTLVCLCSGSAMSDPRSRMPPQAPAMPSREPRAPLRHRRARRQAHRFRGHRRGRVAGDASAVHRAARCIGRSGAVALCRRDRRGAAICAGSAICPPPASTAIAAAAGWTRTPSPRRCRIAAAGGWRRKQDWRRLADRRAVDIFRLAGIYGPGRSAFDDLRAGTRRRIIKPGHAFGRIHRDDIVRAVLAAMRQERASGVRVLNLADDEPAESADVVAEAARLLGIAPPDGRAVRARAGRCDEPDGTQLLGGEPQGLQPADAAGARACAGAIRPIARAYAPSSPRSGRASGIAAPDPAAATGDDRHPSPGSPRTSWLVTCSAMRSAISHGTSGSRWPCSRRTGQSMRDRPVQQQVVRPSSISARVIGYGSPYWLGTCRTPSRMSVARSLEGHRLPHQRLGEVGRGGDADQRGDAIRAGEGGQQRDPAAHRGADQDQRPFGQPVDHGQRILGPAADRAVLEPAAAGAVAGVVEPQHRLAALGAERRERGRLVAGHVAAEAGQEDHGGAAPVLPRPGQFHAIAAIEPSGGLPSAPRPMRRAHGVIYRPNARAD